MNLVKLVAYLLNAQLDKVWLETAPTKVNAKDAHNIKHQMEDFVLL